MAGKETRIQAAKRRVRTARWAIAIAALVGFGGTVGLAHQAGGSSSAAGTSSSSATDDGATLVVADDEASGDDGEVSDDFFGDAQVSADSSQPTSAATARTSAS